MVHIFSKENWLGSCFRPLFGIMWKRRISNCNFIAYVILINPIKNVVKYFQRHICSRSPIFRFHHKRTVAIVSAAKSASLKQQEYISLPWQSGMKHLPPTPFQYLFQQPQSFDTPFLLRGSSKPFHFSSFTFEKKNIYHFFTDHLQFRWLTLQQWLLLMSQTIIHKKGNKSLRYLGIFILVQQNCSPALMKSSVIKMIAQQRWTLIIILKVLISATSKKSSLTSFLGMWDALR